MDINTFDYNLPEELIALRPVDGKRSDARMLVVPSPKGYDIQDSCVHNLHDYLRPGDCIVFNDTAVLAAQLEARIISRQSTANIGITLLKLQSRTGPFLIWSALARGARRLKIGDRLRFGHNSTLQAEMTHKNRDTGQITLKFGPITPEDFYQALDQTGQMPLPPYIASRRPADKRDRTDYQSIFADNAQRHSVAAPTACLHFDKPLVKKLEKAGIHTAYITLHVGAGTFLPIKSDHLSGHKIHSEAITMTTKTATLLNQVRRKKGRIIAVGTTVMRTLETIMQKHNGFRAFHGHTDLFIKPGFKPKAIDGLLTNFHLPRTTLFVLVCSLMGLPRMQAAYAHAIKQKYRFYSYGDCCLLLR